MSIRSYEHALTYLLVLEKKGIFLSIETTQKILEHLGSPHKKFPSVLVAGTNGKGSTVAMLSSILKSGGNVYFSASFGCERAYSDRWKNDWEV